MSDKIPEEATAAGILPAWSEVAPLSAASTPTRRVSIASRVVDQARELVSRVLQQPSTTVETLSNGMTLINMHVPGRRTAGVYIIARAGSRDETPETAGLAHFLEHMFFKGTENRPSTKDITREFDSLGAQINAYTDTEEVCYYAVGPARNAVRMAAILSDMLCHPLFDGEEMERERNVVRQELANRARDDDTWLGDNGGQVAFGGDQPMAWTAGGSDAVIQKVTREQLVDYHKRFYSPERMAIVVSGGTKLTREQAEQMLRDMPSGVAHDRVAAKWGQGAGYIYKNRPALDGEEPAVSLQLMLPGLPTRHEDRRALSVMSAILGGGMSSRLFSTVRERNGLCYHIEASSETFEDSGVFAINTWTRPEHAAKAVELSAGELRRMADEPVSAEELENVKEVLIAGLDRSTETMATVGRIGAQTWRNGTGPRKIEAVERDIRAVTAADVQRLARMLVEELPMARLAVVAPTDCGPELLRAFKGTGVVAAPAHDGLAA